MKRVFSAVITAIVAITLIVFGFISGINLSDLQKETLNILLLIASISALYCFVVGEITNNTSQMDKLWSILPICYTIVVAVKSNFNFRVVLFTLIVLFWGIRLTVNFGRKGAYSIKFWEGKEDYRWAILRKNKILGNKIVWAFFNLFFISIYQNFIVVAITFPIIAIMESTKAIGVLDVVVSFFAVLFLVIETIADENQWKFHKEKNRLLKEGKTLSELPSPYNKGFNTTGIWGYMRHPNYLGEQGIWVSLYFFCLSAGVTKFGIFNWTIFGSMLLILLFLGSSTLGEKISSSKYGEYENYRNSVFKYLPIKKYKA